MKTLEEAKQRWWQIRKDGYNNKDLLVKESEGKGLGVFTYEL